MSGLKHTPGEWFITRSGVTVGQVNIGPPGKIVVKASFYGEEAKANARLIAAAPEMLEALKIAHKSLFLHSEYPQVCREIDAAIAKAEGRS